MKLIACFCFKFEFVFVIVLFSVTHVPRLVATGIRWPNWTETQKMRSEKILKAMQRVEESVMGPEVRL